MKKTFLPFLIVFVTVTFLFVGCKKDESPTSPTDKTAKVPESGYPIPTFGVSVGGVLSTIQVGYTTNTNTYETHLDIGFVYFGTGIDAGTVSVNEKTINKKTEGSSVYYTSIDPSNPSPSLDLYWNGATHAWNVSGSGNIPAFTLNVSSPTAFIVRNPAALSLISKNSALNVTWSGASSTSTDSMMIVLIPVTGSGSTFMATTNNKTGSYTIPANQLSEFSGSVLLEVVKYRYEMKTEGGKSFFGVAEIVNKVNFYFQ